MLKENNVVTGFCAGAVLPVSSWIIFEYLFKVTIINNKPSVPHLIVISINLLIMRYFVSRDADRTVQGVMIATFAFMVMVFVLKMRTP